MGSFFLFSFCFVVFNVHVEELAEARRGEAEVMRYEFDLWD